MPLKVLAAWILAAAALAAQTVEGRVINSVTGAGIPAVAVNFRQGAKAAYSAATDSEGHFRIDDVKNGVYSATYKAPGFWAPPPLQVRAGGEPVHLEAKLQPVGKISGRVLDASGKPVPNAGIRRHWETGNILISSISKADEKGEYSIDNLEVPGPWVLSATAPPSWPLPESRDDERLAWVQTYYPGVTDRQLAAQILVSPGSDLRMDIKLAAVPVHRIRGVVLNVRGDPEPKAKVTIGKDSSSLILRQDTKDDGTFEFESVADDEWGLYSKVDKDGMKQWAAQRVQVKGHDLENVELRLAPSFALQGKIVMEVPEGAPAPQPPTGMLMFYGGYTGNPVIVTGALGDDLFDFKPDSKGDFTIQNLFPGRYRVIPDSPPAAYYLDSIRLGSRDALEAGVQIPSGTQPLTVTYKPNGGTVRGTVESCGAGRVLLIPQDPALRRDGFIQQTTCDQNGRFAIAAVRPGDYFGLALPLTAPAGAPPPESDQSLLNRSTRITVRANESTSAQIRLLRQ